MVSLEQVMMMQLQSAENIKYHLEKAMDAFENFPDDDEDLNEVWQLIKAARMIMEDF